MKTHSTNWWQIGLLVAASLAIAGLATGQTVAPVRTQIVVLDIFGEQTAMDLEEEVARCVPGAGERLGW